MNVLFVCDRGIGSIAEQLFKGKFNVRSAVLHTLDLRDLLTEDTFSWANIVYVESSKQMEEIEKRFPKIYKHKKIVSLDLPRDYDPHGLAEILRSKIKL